MTYMLSLLNMYNGTVSLQLGAHKNVTVQFILYSFDSGGGELLGSTLNI